MEEQVESEKEAVISEDASKDSESKRESRADLLDQIDMLKDALLRKTAESENLRKRLEKGAFFLPWSSLTKLAKIK